MAEAHGDRENEGESMKKATRITIKEADPQTNLDGKHLVKKGGGGAVIHCRGNACKLFLDAIKPLKESGGLLVDVKKPEAP